MTLYYGQRFSVEVQPHIPKRLNRLTELANDLYYSWDRQVRGLFFQLDPQLWESCCHSPKVFLRRISQEKLQAAAQDRIYMQEYNRILSAYDTYLNERMNYGIHKHLDPESDLVAYFCAEFGLHESFPIYSGGLGILAGDQCKAASDIGIPFIGIGLLYSRGYFNQTIDNHGNQIASYPTTDFNNLPVEKVIKNDKELFIEVDLPGRTLILRVWKARAGHINLYFLDSDVERNSEHDRTITYQLYGGDIHNRIKQEIVLGIGGVRLLRALDIEPTVWHINEGHAAFQILERCREYIHHHEIDFDTALEIVAAGTVFTTHTPVPAGHDIFSHDLMHEYFNEYSHKLCTSWDRFMALGAFPGDRHSFNQTALALRGSRFHNGVSKIHGSVSSRMEAYIWPQIPHEENPISHVTNGVHVPTFLARQWVNQFDMYFGDGWRSKLMDQSFWKGIHSIPNHSFWSIRQTLKSELLQAVYLSIQKRHLRLGCSPLRTDKMLKHITNFNQDVLIVGFARRFATYKRATLLFSDLHRLEKIVSIPDKPIIFLFAGKAHPSDFPGQQLIKNIHEISLRPEFIGKIFLLEGYDMQLARKLVTGVDVWLNNPEYPMEASGTSGQKAAINGVLNLSVADGWWEEGYVGDNGWTIVPHTPDIDKGLRDYEEAQELFDLLENEVIPQFYDRNLHGYSESWVIKSKRSMESIIPRFSAQRMMMDYLKKFYSPAKKHYAHLLENKLKGARELALWKEKIRGAWPQVKIRLIEQPVQQIKAGEALSVCVAILLDKLNADDVIVECLLGVEDSQTVCDDDYCTYPISQQFKAGGINEQGETIFEIKLTSTLTGLQHYQIRVFPFNPLLSHRFEVGCMLWL